jgi:hypothetical protein
MFELGQNRSFSDVADRSAFGAISEKNIKAVVSPGLELTAEGAMSE